jgi:hypothetical protein
VFEKKKDWKPLNLVILFSKKFGVGSFMLTAQISQTYCLKEKFKKDYIIRIE